MDKKITALRISLDMTAMIEKPIARIRSTNSIMTILIICRVELIYLIHRLFFVMKVLQRGAEAIIYLSKKDGETVVVKERVKKGYRIPELDMRIRHFRTRNEENLMLRAARAGVSVPKILDRDEFRIIMEYIDGRKLKDVFNTMPMEERIKIYELLGDSIARMHQFDIIHGDLTTSNFILKGDKLYVIDFGLGRFSKRIEDQATDIYLLYEAIKAAHFIYLNEAWQNILNVYKQKYSNSKEVLERVEKISKRRRYKGG